MTTISTDYDGAGARRPPPRRPSSGSERRQVFFDAAIGIPTFFVRQDTGNRFLSRILARARGVRLSRRYPGYLRVPLAEYRFALVRLLREDAPELVEALGAGEVLDDLALRLADSAGGAVAGRLNQGILAELGVRPDADAALDVDARAYNEAAERYYRGTLRRRHTREALARLADDLRALEQDDAEPRRAALRELTGGRSAADVVASLAREVAAEETPVGELRRLIGLLLLTLDRDADNASADLDRRPTHLTAEDTLARHAS